MQYDENDITNKMRVLNLTREQAIQLINDDKEVDRMTSKKQIESDLTEEQKAISKKTRSCYGGNKKENAPTVYKLDATGKKRKTDNDKDFLINIIIEALAEKGITGSLIASNDFQFEYKGKSFSAKIVGHKK